jgi:hypothetical protein
VYVSSPLNLIQHSKRKTFDIAPVSEMVQYHSVESLSSTRGGTLSPYQGKPDPEKDRLWEGLYNGMIAGVCGET